MSPMPMVARVAREVARRAGARAFSSREPTMAEMLSELDEAERAQVMKVLHKVDAEMKREINKRVDLAKEAWTYGDRVGVTNWLCDRCGVPKGEFRDKLIWRCFLGGVFLTAGATGRFLAKCELRRQEKELSRTNADTA